MHAVASDTTARPKALLATTVCESFQTTVAEYPDHPALKYKDSDFVATWAEYSETARKRAAAFAALGVKRGDVVGLMLTNRPAMNLTDAGAMHLGAACFSIYNTSSPEQIEYLLTDAGNTVLITEQEFLGSVLEAKEKIPTLEHIVVVDGEAPDGTMSLDEFEALGDPGFDFEAAWRAVEPDDVLCLIYTSGTTGPPKGVQLTHANLMSGWRSLDQFYPLSPCGRSVSFLPSAHVADRWANHYASMTLGTTVHCCPNPRDMVFYSIEVRPTLWGGVPRIWEKLKVALEAGFAGEQDEQKKQAIDAALAIGRERATAKQQGPVPEELEAKWQQADEQVFSVIRKRLGLDVVELFAVGAAPTPPEVILFFDAIGIEIAELWGMSETTALATIGPPGQTRIGKVGKAIPGVEVKLAEDGEVMVRGPIVMKGYRNMPEKTAEAIDADGWLYTGDIGEFDDDGYLSIVDRKKELIINAAGKNMSPANIEAKIKAESPLVAHAVAIGDRRPYNVALIVLDPDGCGGFAASNGIADASPAAMAGEQAVKDEINAGIERANARLSRVEQLKKFEIVAADWQPGGDELTPTMKLKRKPIAEKYAAAIDALYAD